jgi:hypothetical protein
MGVFVFGLDCAYSSRA